MGDSEGRVKMPLRITAWEAGECCHSLGWDPGRRRRLGHVREETLTKGFLLCFPKCGFTRRSGVGWEDGLETDWVVTRAPVSVTG